MDVCERTVITFISFWTVFEGDLTLKIDKYVVVENNFTVINLHCLRILKIKQLYFYWSELKKILLPVIPIKKAKSQRYS